MIWRSKENLLNTEDLRSYLNISADAVYQAYKALDDYIGNEYSTLKCDPNKDIFIMIVTLEDWYVGYNNLLYEKIKENVIDSFITDNKRADKLINFPYIIFSADEFEYCIQIIKTIGIKNYFNRFIYGGGNDAFKEFDRVQLFEEEVHALMKKP